MSRYPSAYGHTPSYRSYTSVNTSRIPTYPSTPSVGRRVHFDVDSPRERASTVFRDDFSEDYTSFSRKSRKPDVLSSNFDQEFLKLKNDLLDDHMFSRHGFNASDFGKSSNNSYKSEISSSLNGGIPHRESYTETIRRSEHRGTDRIPHTSYSYSSSHFDSERPHFNRVSSYSYNL